MAQIDLLGSQLEIDNDGKPLADIAEVGTHFVESVNVKISLLRLFTVEVNLSPTLPAALKLLNSGLLGIGMNVKKSDEKVSGTLSKISTAASIAGFSLGDVNDSISLRKMNIRMHYGGLHSGWFVCYLLAPQIDLSAEGINIKLNGIGATFIHTKSSGNSVKKGNLADVVEDLLTAGIDAEYEIDPDAEKILDKQVSFTQYKNNLETVQEILMKHNCMHLIQGADEKGKTKILVQTIAASRKEANTSFIFYGQISPTERIFPGLDLSCPTTNVTMPGGAWAHTINVMNTDKKKTGKPLESSDPKLAEEKKSNQTSPDQSVAAGNVSKDVEPKQVHSNSKMADLFKNKYHSYTDKIFEYELTTVGVVDLMPGIMVHVQVGEGENTIEVLSGNYDVFEVDHTFSKQGIETKLQLYRLGGTLQAGTEKVTGFLKSAFSGDKKDLSPEKYTDMLDGGL